MRKVTLTYGLLAGAIVSILMLLAMVLWENGAIKFVKGLQVGALTTLIASLMYAASWETFYQTNPEIKATFMDKYAEHSINKMKAKGASPAEIDQKAKEMADMKEMYKNPVIRFGITVLEILPVGIVITLISAAVLRRKDRKI
jgi:hypothetical protein